MANIIETILIVLVIAMYICTWIAQPQLSWNYTKEFFKSGLTVLGWCKDRVVDMIGMFNKEETNASKTD